LYRPAYQTSINSNSYSSYPPQLLPIMCWPLGQRRQWSHYLQHRY